MLCGASFEFIIYLIVTSANITTMLLGMVWLGFIFLKYFVAILKIGFVCLNKKFESGSNFDKVVLIIFYVVVQVIC